MKPEFGNLEQIATLRRESELNKYGYIDKCTGICLKRHKIKDGYIYFEWLEISMGRYEGRDAFYECDESEPSHRFDMIVRGFDFNRKKTKDPIYPCRVPLENIIYSEGIFND